jgi:hypothetical protein
MSGATADGFFKACVKFYASHSGVTDDAALFVPIFHEWIRAGELDLMMFDVADYAHAPDSPGIMLVCHEISFALDRTDERFGLHAQRRTRFEGPAAEAVADLIRHTVIVAAKLEADERVSGELTLDASTFRVEANDRLRVPNSDEGYQVFAGVVRQALERLLPDATPRISRVENDARDRLTVEVGHDAGSSVAELRAALTPAVPQGSV